MKSLKFLVDNSLSPLVASLLRENGFDAVHVLDLGMAASSDDEIMAYALSDERIVIAADTDFGDLLALSGAPEPSVVLFRGLGNRRAGRQVLLLLANLATVEYSLREGAIVVFQNDRIRVRDLPVVDEQR